jgi:hypothetical protein
MNARTTVRAFCCPQSIAVGSALVAATAACAPFDAGTGTTRPGSAAAGTHTLRAARSAFAAHAAITTIAAWSRTHCAPLDGAVAAAHVAIAITAPHLALVTLTKLAASAELVVAAIAAESELMAKPPMEPIIPPIMPTVDAAPS